MPKKLKEKELTPEQSLRKDKDFYHDLKALKDTEGGKILIEALIKDTINMMNWLANSYETAPEMELRTRCARLQSTLSMLSTLNNAETNEADIDILIEEALHGE